MRVVGLFSGIGGLEIPFQRAGSKAELLCDVWEPSRQVLQTHFPGVRIEDDVQNIKALPKGTEIVTAGFPCTDLSQAGRTAGIRGSESGLVEHVFRLVKQCDPEWLVLENVRNMLVLDGGDAMTYLTTELAKLRMKWAYRLVDSRFTGVPQRRHRVILVASRKNDPRGVLFADNELAPPDAIDAPAFGFYWTEGLRGLGWAPNAVPPLKGGSKVGIPSPPALWIPSAPVGSKFVVPSIQDAEALQGFERDWTQPAQERTKQNGPRWKLVGNAVSVGVGEWIAERIMKPGQCLLDGVPTESKRWPRAAYGEQGRVFAVDASEWPAIKKRTDILDVVHWQDAKPLSARAIAGFSSRLARSSLRQRHDDNFVNDLDEHYDFHKPSGGIAAAR